MEVGEGGGGGLVFGEEAGVGVEVGDLEHGEL